MDRHITGEDNRIKLYDLITIRRLNELATATRIAIVKAAQRGRTGGRDERAILNVFQGTRGPDLTLLKNGIDQGEDYRDLQQLVYSDLDDSKIRLQLLTHLKQEGDAHDTRGLKVLSDIDDTFYASLKDQRFPKGVTYPGVVQYYQELVRGPAQAGTPGGLVFLTARPKDRGGAIEEHTRDSLASRGNIGPFTVLSGDFVHLIGNDQIADKKFDNFAQYRLLFPEYGFVFTGDSGQGDAQFGKRIRSEFQADVRGIFIHDVVDTDAHQREIWRSEGVHFFDTYVGAAVEACTLGLMTREGVQRVIDAAQTDLARIPFTSSQQNRDRLAELDRDVQRAAALPFRTAHAQ
jgi:hypothetical protein